MANLKHNCKTSGSDKTGGVRNGYSMKEFADGLNLKNIDLGAKIRQHTNLILDSGHTLSSKNSRREKKNTDAFVINL